MADEQLGGGDVRAGGVYWDLYVRTEALRAAGPVVAQTEQAIAAAGAGAQAALDRLGKQASATGGALEKEATAAAGAAAATQTVGKAADQTAVSMGKASGSASPFAAALSKTESAATTGHKALRKMEGGLIAIAASASSTSAPVAAVIQSLLMFNVGATTILGVAAAVAVLSKGYDDLTESSRKLEEQDQKTHDALQAVRDAAKPPQEAANDLLLGAYQQQRDALNNLKKAQAEYNAAAAAGSLIPGLTSAAQQPLIDAAAKLAQANKDLETAQKNVATVGRQSRIQEIQDLIEARTLRLNLADGVEREVGLVRELRAIETDTSKPLKDRIEARKILNDLADQERQKARDLRDILIAGQQAAADQTKALSDNARVALEQFDARAADQLHGITDPQAQQRARNALDAQRRFAVENLRAANLLDAAGPANALNDFDAIDAKIQDLIAGEQKLTVGGQAFEAVEKRISELEDQKTQLMQNQLNYAKQRDQVEGQNEAKQKASVERTHQSLEDQVKLIASAATAAIQLAAAFGLVDDAATRALESIVQIATEIPDLVKAINQLQEGKGSTAAVISAALPVVGAIASLASSIFGGESPEDKARRDALVENSEVIKKLTEQIGSLGLPGITGSQFADAQAALGKIGSAAVGNAFAGQFAGGPEAHTQLDRELASYGTSLRDLQDLADALHVNANFFSKDAAVVADSFVALRKALAATKLAEFTQTFAGQLDALALEEKAFNITDPTKQLEKYRDLVSRGPVPGSDSTDPLGSPILKKALEGLDLTTAAGRAQAQANIQQVVLALESGTLKPEDLGGLQGDQFKQAISDLIDLINKANDQATGGGGSDTSSFSVARLATNEQFDQLIGLTVSSNVYLSEISARGTEVRDLLAATLFAFTGVQPPVIPQGGPPGGGGAQSPGSYSLSVGEIQIVIQAAPGASPAAIGADAADQVVDALLARLGDDLRARRLLLGRAGVS